MAGWSLAERALLLLLCLGLPACKHRDVPCPEPTVLHVATQPPRPLEMEVAVQPLPAKVEEPPLLTPQAFDHALPIVKLGTPEPSHPPPPVTTAPRTGLLLALDLAFNGKHDEAVAAIKHLPADDQDFILTVLARLLSIHNGEVWPSLPGPQKHALLQSLRNLDRRLSKSAPLLLRRVMYVEDERGRGVAFGEVKPRPDSKYRPEDYVQVYAELVNLVDAPAPDGLHNTHLYTTIEIRGDDNQVHFADRKPSQRPGSVSPRTDSFLYAVFALPRLLPPGHFQLVVKVEDLDTGRTAQQTLPLHVLNPRPRRNP